MPKADISPEKLIEQELSVRSSQNSSEYEDEVDSNNSYESQESDNRSYGSEDFEPSFEHRPQAKRKEQTSGISTATTSLTEKYIPPILVVQY